MELSDLAPELRIARPPVLSGRVELTGHSQTTFSQTPQKDVAVELRRQGQNVEFTAKPTRRSQGSNLTP